MVTSSLEEKKEKKTFRPQKEEFVIEVKLFSITHIHPHKHFLFSAQGWKCEKRAWAKTQGKYLKKLHFAYAVCVL